jgi:flagellum-specific peptidoglycan hydrolase FlgJ
MKYDTYLKVGMTAFSLLFIGMSFFNQEPIEVYDPQTFEKGIASQLKSSDTKGINPDYILVVAIHETGWGESKPYQQLHNLFSMNDDKNGVLIGDHKYKKYTSDKEAIEDFIRCISTRPRYAKAFRAGVFDNRPGFFRALANAGYAQDPAYAKGLEQTFQNYKYRQFKKSLQEIK